MIERFKQCLKVVLVAEGGYVNHKSDRGGATNFGITQHVYDDFNKTRNQPTRDVKFIHESEVETIYYTSYWLPAACDKLPEPLDLLVFDFAVNSGVGRASKMLQACVGVTQDGKIGKNTIAAVTNKIVLIGINKICFIYLEARKEFFNKIVERDASQKVFLKGWMNRIAHLEKGVNLA